MSSGSPHPALPSPAAPEFLVLQRAVAGRYSLERELGRGGMGIVFLGRDVALDRPVAIKLLPPELAARPELRQAFLREARTAAGLAHPHIVPVHAVEEHDDLVFFVMGFVDGETLGARVRRRGPLPAAEAMRIMQEVAWALGHAHAHGIVHRDVKPDNILLERDTGRAIVTDFGIAHAVQSLDRASTLAAGTPQYMSPEQARGGPVDGRSDLYSLGVTAHFMLLARLPFEAANVNLLIHMHADQSAPLLRTTAPHVPGAFANLVTNLLAKSPSERIGSAESLAAAIASMRGAQGSVPAPVRRYLDASQQAAGEIGTLLSAGGAVILGMEAIKLFQGDFLGLASLIEFVPTLAFAGLAAVRAAQLLGNTRRLISQGYQLDAVRVGAATLAREESAGAPPADEHSSRARTWWQFVLGAGITTAGFTLLGANGVPSALQALGWVIGVSTPPIMMHAALRQLHRGAGGTLWQRLLRARFGRALFTLARRSVHEAPSSPSPEPTVVLLARATEDLFHGLPGHLRKQFGDVPTLVARLQADAAASYALEPDDPTRQQRLETAVIALENIRMDLLRLHAGRGALDDLTADLERVRHVDRRVDAFVELRTPTPV